MRRSDGFTLVEVMLAAAIGLIVFTGALALMGTAFRDTHGVIARTDAMQRGRLALDEITQELRSQVCPDPSTPAVAGGDDSSVTFYADLSDGSRPPVEHVLALDPASMTIVDRSGPGAARVVLDAVDDAPGTPFLRYYAFTTAGTPRTATLPLPTPLSAADAARVARIDIAFRARPQGERTAEHATVLTDEVLSRNADPEQADPGPVCAT